MTYLLDTHVFLWSAFTPDRLSHQARTAIMEPSNRILVSAVSFWELSLKYGLGKLELTGITPAELPAVARSMGFETLSLDAEGAATFHRLPRTAHRDPFDRMLVWQAVSCALPLISKDANLSIYAEQGLTVTW